eukprot:14534054-Alexandrium_andersonii.AAC.1
MAGVVRPSSSLPGLWVRKGRGPRYGALRAVPKSGWAGLSHGDADAQREQRPQIQATLDVFFAGRSAA